MKTSFSSASLQIGRRCERQKALLHVAQLAGAARGSRRRAGLLREDGGETCVERGMIVLFVKQVHLQNRGGAEVCVLVDLF